MNPAPGWASDEQSIRALYRAFNSRDIDAVLASMSDEIDWPNAWEGGRLQGKEAVRAYWTRQWKAIDPHVEPLSVIPRSDGRLAVDVHQVVRTLDGQLVADGSVWHVYTIVDGVISKMEVEESVSDTAGVIAPPPLIYLSALGIGFGLNAVMGTGSPSSSVALPVGVASIIAGTGLMGSFVRAFGRARTPIDPYTPSQAIVTDGPYRLTRNPGYLGMALAYAGITLVAKAPWALVPLPVAIAVIDRGVIVREERYLERKFGAAYLDYKRRVRRWV